MQAKKWSALALAMVLALSLALTGCGSGGGTSSEVPAGEPAEVSQPEAAGEDSTASGNGPTIRFVHQDTASTEQMKMITDALDGYAESKKGEYNLVQEVVAGDELKSKVRIDLASDNLADILWYWGTAADASSLVANGQILEVDEFFAVSEKLSRDSFQDLFDGLSINGKNYCLPADNLEANWVVNKTLFEEYNLEYPKTYDDVIELAKTFGPEGIATIAMGSKGGNPSHFWVDMIYSQYEGARDEMLNLSETWNIDTENFRATLDLVKELIAAGALPEDTIANGDWGPYFALFSEGKAAMTWGWAGMIAGLPAEFEYEFIDPPQVAETGYDTTNMSIAWCGAGIMINRDSFNDPEKQAAIVDFVEFYFSEEFQQTTLYADGVIPTLMDIAIDDTQVDPAIAEIIARNSGKEVYLTHLNTMPDANVWVDYQSGLDEFFAGSMTTDDYIQYVQNSMDQNKP